VKRKHLISLETYVKLNSFVVALTTTQTVVAIANTHAHTRLLNRPDNYNFANNTIPFR